MNKRYMDFVPARKKSAAIRKETKKPVVAEEPAAVKGLVVAKRSIAAKKSVVKEPAMPALGAASKKSVAKTTKVDSHPRSMATRKDLELGVIEDLNTNVIEVATLEATTAHGHALRGDDELKLAKATNLKARKPAEKISGLKTKEAEVTETFKPPKTPFINQDKVVKRPLSKNVYQKKVATKEEVKGPVTIITKPEKSTKVSLIVIIILTIILGAVAGTVAFLLLPK